MALKDFQNSLFNRNHSYTRRYETRVFWFPELETPEAIVEVNQFDPYHDMTLYLRVNLMNLKITDFAVDEKRVPYKSCPMAIESYSYLLGSEMSERKLIGNYPERTKGCLHLNELIENAARSFQSAFAFYLKEKVLPPEQDEYRMYSGTMSHQDRIELGRHWWMKDRSIRNSCFSFSTVHEDSNWKETVKEYPSVMTEMARAFKNAKREKNSAES